MNKKITLMVGIICVLAVAYYAISPIFIKKVVNESAPSLANGENVATSSKVSIIDTKTHPASGEVSVVKSDSKTYVRYENFKTLNGPDLFVYLANDLDAKDFVNLGELKATEGNVNYKVPQGVDVKNYKYVMVWCKQFGVLFNYADISTVQ